MKKIALFLSSIFLTVFLFGFFISREIFEDKSGIYSGRINLPVLMPGQNLLAGLWIAILITTGFGLFYVISNPVQINRRKNVFINFLILLGLWFLWTFMLFSEANIIGVLALAITAFILSMLVIFMFWLVDHRAGTIIIPAVVWNIFLIVLSIALKVQN